MSSAQEQVELVVRTIAQTAVDNEKYFGDLDSVVGDGDFGYSLARGFEKVLEGWDAIDRADVGTFLKKTGMIVTSRIGGTSGPIWGTAFLKAGMTAGSADTLSGEQVVAMLRAATDGIKARGQADVGDKTLLDALAHPDTLRYIPEYNLIMRADAPREDKVSIVQGSGSGHEPAHVMVVGKGMLDAACPGDVFAAPPMDYVYETAKKLASPKGVLLLVNNYTGDRMAFDMGKEMAESEGVRTEILMINDDVAVKDSTYTIGRRGVAGNFFVMKAVGAAAEQGAELDEVIRIGKKVNDVTRTMGVALTACTPPAKGSPLFELGEDEIELGVGIHGEPGRERTKLVGADEIVDRLLEAVVTDLPYTSGDRVALMVNGLGGTPISELYILYRRAHQQLAERGITVGRSYVNEYCTSLDMAGASLTLVRLDDEIEALLAAPAEIAARVF